LIPARTAGLAALVTFAILPGSAAASPTHTYLVLPFEDTAPEASRDWLREAMALSIGEYLVGAGQKVIDREDRLVETEEMNLPPGASLTLATSIRLGRQLRGRGELNPDRLVVGKFGLDQGRLSLSARILHLNANRAMPWRQEEGSLKDLIRFQKALAHSLLRDDGIPSGALAAVADDAGLSQSFPLVAYENYVRGRIEPDPARQQGFLRKATQQFTGYPKASFHLARLLAKGGKNSEAEAVLKKIAREPAPYIADYHALVGLLAFRAGRLPEAEEEARTSLALRETAEARLLMARIEQGRGELEAARREVERAAALDPENPEIEGFRKSLVREAGSDRPR
jgi:tetratricopeptide (TPR) repeat protein